MLYGNVDKIHGSAGCDERGLSMQNRSYLKSIFFRKVIEQEGAKSPLLVLTTPAKANCFGWGCSLCEMTFEASSCSLCKMTLNHLLYKYEQTCSNTNLKIITKTFGLYYKLVYICRKQTEKKRIKNERTRINSQNNSTPCTCKFI